MKPNLTPKILAERLTTNSKFSGILEKAMSSRKNPHAVVLGRLGGLKGGPARTLAMSPEARHLQAQKAARTRWLKLSPTLEAALPDNDRPTKKVTIMTKVTKLSVNLSPDVVEAIRQLATKRKVTMTEVIRDAIGTEKFIEDEKSSSKFLLEDCHGKLRQVFFR
jgi:hypothetical protein